MFSFLTADAATGVARQMVAGETAATLSAIGSVALLPCIDAGIVCSLRYEYVPSQLIVLPPVTLASSESVQVAVTSSAETHPESPQDCNGSIAFYGPDGAAIGAPTAFSVNQSPTIFLASLPYAAAGQKALTSLVSAQIALTANPITVPYLSPIPPCTIAFSMKTYDSITSAVHTFMGGQSVRLAFAPQGTAPVAEPQHLPGR